MSKNLQVAGRCVLSSHTLSPQRGVRWLGAFTCQPHKNTVAHKNVAVYKLFGYRYNCGLS